MDTVREPGQDILRAEVEFLSPDVRAELLKRWNEPARGYHNEAHLRSVLRAIDFLSESGELFDGTAVRLAAWFHDAIYEPAGSENKQRSAAFASEHLPAQAPVDEVVRLVGLANGHRVDHHDPNGAVFADADLAILGAEPEIYDAYATDVRHEYGHVPSDRFIKGRILVLRSLLERKALFVTTPARDEWEQQSRANLNRELGLLLAGKSVRGSGPEGP